MRPFTPWGGVDSPNKGEVSPCLGFLFLNPSACQVCLHCIIYHVISYLCLTFYLRNHLFYPPYFLLLSWEISAITFRGWQKKHIRLLFFCLGKFWTFRVNRCDFISHARRYLCIYFHLACFCCFSVLFFNIIKKIKNKNLGRRCRILYFFYW
jgi:hypothetical protein